MKNLFALLSISFLVCFNSWAESSPESDYERFLESFSVDYEESGIQLTFTLDNGWTFTSQVSPFEEHKLFALDKLVGSRAFIAIDPFSPALEITLENPAKKGARKMSFLAIPTKETYLSSTIIVDIEIYNYLAFKMGYILTANDLSWEIRSSLGIESASSYWSPSDHVLITKRYDEDNCYSVVNLDVSPNHYINYNPGEKQSWYSISDVRLINVKYEKIIDLSKENP